jgi:hypothetical protein
LSRSKTGRAGAELLLLPLLLGAGCFNPYSKHALPMRLYSEEQATARGLPIGPRAEMTRSGLRLFTWPVELPSAVGAVDDLIDGYQAVGIANLEVDFHEWTILQVVSFPQVTVAGNLVLPRRPPPGAGRGFTARAAWSSDPPRAPTAPASR